MIKLKGIKVKQRAHGPNGVALGVQSGSYCSYVHHFITKTIAVVTLQAFTRGKSFYLGKISLGKFTSGFIFPWLKGHTGDHWIKF